MVRSRGETVSLSLEPLLPDRIETLRALVHEPSLEAEFDFVAPPGALEDWLGFPRVDPQGGWLGMVEGEPAGFCLTMVLPGAQGHWAMLRLGVVERHRRRGLGSVLLQAALARLESRQAELELREVSVSAWLPNAVAPLFAERHGFRHARYFWLMERPRGSIPEVTWPPGVETRLFDGSEQALEDWNRAYNESFAQHHHFVLSSLEDCRAFLRNRDWMPDGLLLAYREGRCVGFCRDRLDNVAGEVAILGVVAEARGIGLGRALLRWGVGQLERAHAPRVTLLVDGENETALSLYGSEGFQTARTRQIWVRPTR